MSERRDSNPRLQAWEACILPLNYSRKKEKIHFSQEKTSTFCGLGEIMEWSTVTSVVEKMFQFKIGIGPIAISLFKLLLFFGLVSITFWIAKRVTEELANATLHKLPLDDAAKVRLQKVVRYMLLLGGLLGTLALLGVNLSILNSLYAIINFPLFKIGGASISLGAILLFFILLIGFSYLSKILSTLLVTKGLSKVNIEEGRKYVLKRIIEYILIAIGAVIAFQSVGINLSGLAVIFGLLSVGIGFGLQNVASNFISGIILLLERPIQIGDRITVGDTQGDVEEINIRSTTIRSLDNISIIVPNTEFIEGRVTNWSHGDLKIRMNIDVGVSYSSNLDIVLTALNEVADEHPKVLKSPKPEVLLLEFADSSWNMQLRAWIADPKDYHPMLSAINCAIVHKFREQDIQIPFPQRDLHVRSSDSNSIGTIKS
jgi:small-conductance mechanosensitive channel